MKIRTIIIALAIVVASAFSIEGFAAKKKEKAQKKQEKSVVTMTTQSDTLSYVAGMSLTQGLVEFLQHSMKIDTAYMADFISGLEKTIESADDPQFKAYMAGMEIAKQLKEKMLPGMARELKDSPDSLVEELAFRGFIDALQGDTTYYNIEDASLLFKDLMSEAKEAKTEKLYGENRRAGEQFLAENSKKEGVTTTESGLQYKVIVEGKGEKPQATDRVKVNYEGRLVDGTVFDSSAKHGDKPLEFKANQVIKGWTEALTLMPVGSKWELYIPYDLAYGERDSGKIKPFSALIFTVELVEIVKK
ncbi:MAG: FKBP-type peptidyl-prolyl cis-trans isomerase [Prevotellaceae bacterium]|nr:FKBP-type peptidyl-prolyl cis-trans isomerase [Prevotellaceae bacterium]MDD5993216.1 FKBP-type peptidyl-prolyl cis-trans isomerase [Prevotellaceae bacterium]MDD6112045.1 FKBP-type peptidyl-prolyl cis-trans isomerase [Prevotellaceae bacterium]